MCVKKAIPAGDVIASRLGDVLGRGAVLTGDAIGPEYRCDESLHGSPAEPAAVLRPGSTAEVSAAVKAAAELSVPVTARGAGTGLSGACVPVAGGVVISFERMAAVLEIDDANHVAVVQPGLTLAELDARTRGHGLVYPVFPGTSAATLGGNVATNAGEVIRSGRFVKNATGYDLTQLITGSEGTLALVSEATLRLHPRLTATASLLAPFGSVDDVARVIPQIVTSGLQPMICEYIDRGTMTGLLRASDLRLGIPAQVAARTGAYLVLVLESRTAERLADDVADAAARLGEAGAYDVYVLLEGQGADLLAAREQAFWMVKAAGADDLIDMVVPRSRIPEYLRRVQELARQHGSRVFGCGHAGDGNIHFPVYEPDERKRSGLLQDIFAMGVSIGGAISGEHGIGRAKKRYYQALEDPAKLALQRRIKAAFDPAGVLNPGCVFDLAEAGPAATSMR
jgi:glycolate oxidase